MREHHLRIYVESSSVEVFANGGQAVITDLIYPEAEAKRITVDADDDNVVFSSLYIYELIQVKNGD